MTPQLEAHRAAFKAHLAEFFKEHGPLDNPEYGGTLVDWCWDWFKAHPLPARYRVLIQEGPHLLPIWNYPKAGGFLEFADFEAAKAEAMNRVDDALPRNTVLVMAYMGYAGFAGDGGSYWQDPQ